MAAAVTEASLKPRQLQVTRLRREEEEESWISGEELYTEGSSDDEAAPGHSRSPAHHPHPLHKEQLTADQSKNSSTHDSPPTTPPSAASEPAQQNDPHLTETTRRLSLMGLENVENVESPTASTTDTEEVEEQEEVMLWRPKRGSIKLPHVELDPPSSSLLEQVSG
ncbi:uncharacterized protein LOC121869970 [Homarus americanus]|nr:uncharacterized protein LOC121869970 [Homarus americanus]XP_042227524.1 uncharacterized protein LOC121869970 [Homarus americanus]